jgi:hypothetical protein
MTSRFLALATLCAIAVGLLYSLGLGGDFMLDDKPTIVLNQAVHATSADIDSLTRAAFSFHAQRPLPMLTFALDHWRAGLDPTAFKATNITLHALTTLVLAGFLRLLLLLAGWPVRRAAWGALAMALAWALHPLLVSSVFYVVQRMQTMATLFLLLALWAYLKGRQAQIDARPNRLHWILVALWWLLALACKEDAALLPAFTLLLESTVLRFRAASPVLSSGLRKCYLFAVIASLALYALVVVPHYWEWQAYPFRDFSTVERLLTQGRVLVLHLWQIVWPWPGNMPFFYDGLVPSRGLSQPASTAWALLALTVPLVAAWYCRNRRPLVALGIAWFFVGHAISSNVVGLELAFEHRNHLPLVGLVIAGGDMFLQLTTRLRLGARTAVGAMALLLSGLSAATTLRLDTWSKDAIGFAQDSVLIAGNSERAWAMLCEGYHARSGGDTTHPDFVRAISACEQGTRPPHGITNLANLVVLKSEVGTVTPADWARLLGRVPDVAMTPDNIGALWYVVKHAYRNPRIDPRNTLKLIDAISDRVSLEAVELASLGYFIASKPALQEHAYHYYAGAVAKSPAGSPLASQLIAELEAQGRQDWAESLRKIEQLAPIERTPDD